MSDNQTTKLREKLTERGVEWIDESNGFADVTTFIANGAKWTVISKSYLNPEHDWMTMNAERITPEQVIAATLGSGTLTAEQVREAIMSVDRWKKPMGNTGLTNTHLIIRDDAWQAIANKLNAELGSESIDYMLNTIGKLEEENERLQNNNAELEQINTEYMNANHDQGMQLIEYHKQIAELQSLIKDMMRDCIGCKFDCYSENNIKGGYCEIFERACNLTKEW
jgi:hypothetical protein